MDAEYSKSYYSKAITTRHLLYMQQLTARYARLLRWTRPRGHQPQRIPRVTLITQRVQWNSICLWSRGCRYIYRMLVWHCYLSYLSMLARALHYYYIMEIDVQTPHSYECLWSPTMPTRRLNELVFLVSVEYSSISFYSSAPVSAEGR